ncbi:hypothetical protein BH24ACT23_BH24ACT23_12020 [soil metagenome]
MVTARAVLGEEGWAALSDDLDELFRSVNQTTDGSIHIEGEYLEVVARKPADG